jgi:hypothetical protein
LEETPMNRVTCLALLPFAFASLVGCSAAVDGQTAEPVEAHPVESGVTPTDNNTAVVRYCTWSQSSYWCQDFYTKGWCTNGIFEQAWDYTGCTWRGWNSANEFCGTGYPGYSDGWEWGLVHIHCL